jgi:hypothetical protein
MKACGNSTADGSRGLHLRPETRQDDEANPATWFFTMDGFDPYHSPLWYLTGAGGLVIWPKPLQMDSLHYWGWLAHAPYLIFGALLELLFGTSRAGCTEMRGDTPHCRCTAFLRGSSARPPFGLHNQKSARPGNLWHNFHRDRRCTHVVRSSRSRALELAENPTSGSFPCPRHRIAVFVARYSSDGPRADVLRRANSPTRGNGHLGLRMWHWIAFAIHVLRFTSGSFCPKSAPRQLLRRNLALVSHARSLRAVGLANWRKVARLLSPPFPRRL